MVFVYDFFTFPIYYCAQQPWKTVDAAKRIRANVVSKSESEIILRPTYKTCPGLEQFKAAGIDTMDKCWKVRYRVPTFPHYDTYHFVYTLHGQT
jgi:3-methyladenine DNA glycosylase/8-oxoguanine DNA glycosylase